MADSRKKCEVINKTRTTLYHQGLLVIVFSLFLHSTIVGSVEQWYVVRVQTVGFSYPIRP